MVLFLSKSRSSRSNQGYFTSGPPATNFGKYKSKHSFDKKKVLAAHNIDMANHRIDNSPFEIKLADALTHGSVAQILYIESQRNAGVGQASG
jgi:hypothetical protein